MPRSTANAILPAIALIFSINMILACGQSIPSTDVEATISAGVQATVSANIPVPTPPAVQDSRTAQTQILPTETPTGDQNTAAPSPVTKVEVHPTATSLPTPSHTPAPTAVPTPTISELVENVKQSLVFIETEDATGTGFIIDEDGIVITNAHVVGNSYNVSASLEDGRQFIGEVLGVDETADLAVLQLVATRKFETMTLADSESVLVGDEAFAIGFPLSYELGGSLTVTRGIISSRRIEGGLEQFQTDAAINTGNSGGPLINREGEVVGVNYAKLFTAQGNPVDNVGLAIATNELKIRLDSLISGVQVRLPTPIPTRETRTATKYTNEEFGYSIDIPAGLSQIKGIAPNGVAFTSIGNRFRIEISPIPKYGNPTPEEIAEALKNNVENGEVLFGWQMTEVIGFEKLTSGQIEYYAIGYRMQSSAVNCVASAVGLVYFPESKPYSILVEGVICEDNYEEYEDALLETLSSFAHE